MNNLLILGAGGMGHMIQETALQIGYDSVAFLDDAKKGKNIIGKCCDYENFLQSYDTAVAALWRQQYEASLDGTSDGSRISGAGDCSSIRGGQSERSDRKRKLCDASGCSEYQHSD